MNLTPLLIAIALGSGCILGMLTYFHDISIVYQPVESLSAATEGNITIVNQTFNSLGTLMGNIQNSTSSMIGAGFSLSGIYDSVLVFIGVVKFIAGAPYYIIQFMTAGLSQVLGIGGGNTWFVPMVTIIITIVIVSLVAAIVMKRLQSEI